MQKPINIYMIKLYKIKEQIKKINRASAPMNVPTKMAGFKVVLLLCAITLAFGFSWKNCVVKTNQMAPVLKVHGCEDGKEVLLSCPTGKKLSILTSFFGHGHGLQSSCDSSLLRQNCRASNGSVLAKLKLLCQDKQSCKVDPTEDVLGDTSCLFGLEADLFIEYVCNPVYVKDAISIKSMELSPSALRLPGKINLSISVLVKRHLAATTKLKLDVEKKAFGFAWISVPFISGTYDNFCMLLREKMFSKCDQVMENEGIPCDCPIPTGLFNIPTQSITITKEQIDRIPGVLGSLVEGEYRITAEFYDVYERPLGCIQLMVEVADIAKKRSIETQLKLT